MNGHHIINAVESVEEALLCTPDPAEREGLAVANDLLRHALRKRGIFIGTGTGGNPSRSLCQTHPNVDCKHAWGCPECVRELRERNDKLREALKLVLLFHSGSPWDFEKQQAWANGLTAILGNATSRDPKVVGANGDGTWDGACPTNEATTKNLCNAARAALKT